MRILTSLLLLGILFNQSIFAQEEGFEYVNPPVTLVVLGSSTAAGAGTWPMDNAWVNRFRCHVQNFNHENQVINLAKGGYNSYHLLPTGSRTRNRMDPDTTRNITKAMEYNPVGIIINLPSNDVSNGYSVKEQLDNFRKYKAYADQHGVELWVTTTQPRNFPSQRDRKLQLAVRDSLLRLFPENCIDFWTDFTDPNLMVVKKYDSGDGCHFNNEGHRILADRVIQSQAFVWKLKETSIQRDISIENQEELSPHLMKIGFKGRIEFDEENADVRRFVKLVQEDRVLNEIEVPETKYDIQTIVDLRYPFQIVYEAPYTLTKSIIFDFSNLESNEGLPEDYFYPIEMIDMSEVPLDSFTYRFPNSSIDVAKFGFNPKKMVATMDKEFVLQQKRRLEDASIAPPAKGNKRTTYWENGNKKSVLKFRKGQLHGKSTWYHTNETKERVVKFKKGKYNGKYVEYYDNGFIKSRRFFKNDKQVGETETFKIPGTPNF